MSFRTGTRVEWNDGIGTETGQVVRQYTHPVTMSFDGDEITCDGCTDDPAYRIERADGDQVLQPQSALTRAS